MWGPELPSRLGSTLSQPYEEQDGCKERGPAGACQPSLPQATITLSLPSYSWSPLGAGWEAGRVRKWIFPGKDRETERGNARLGLTARLNLHQTGMVRAHFQKAQTPPQWILPALPASLHLLPLPHKTLASVSPQHFLPRCPLHPAQPDPHHG